MTKKGEKFKILSLFSGAGGLDLGFKKAGFDIVWANDSDKDSCETYKNNIGPHIQYGDINNIKNSLTKNKFNVDLLIGGPPCQGFSVAGRMDAKDPRSKHVWTFVEVLDKLSPRAFVMENVKALGELKKWVPLREKLIERMRDLGYSVNFIVANASDFDVPQSRERVFFIGFKTKSPILPDLIEMLRPYQKKAQSVREALSILNKAGTGNNVGLCKAKITLTNKPVLRKSPYAGMLFNGLGRPVKIDGYCATLPASMGGNKTPIIDEEELYNQKKGWVCEYHHKIINRKIIPRYKEAPSHLRRLTVEEAIVIQTFPTNYNFFGSQSSKFKQIGNAVPCNLAFQIAKMVKYYLENYPIEKYLIPIDDNPICGEINNGNQYRSFKSREEIISSV